MRRASRGLAAVAALGLLAAACGDDDTTAEDPIEGVPDDGATGDAAADEDMTDDEDMTGEEGTGDEMAEDEMMGGSFVVTLTNTSDGFAISASGAQAVPSGADEPGPALPGSAYEFDVPRSAANLSFATMFVQTNDWFWAPTPEGIALTGADGVPVSGDVTDQIGLWDAGTEVDQTPGEGADQAPRQVGPNTGDADADATVRAVEGFDPADYIAVTLTPNDDGSTAVRIENVSETASVPGPIAPVAWAVHADGVTFFSPGDAAPAGFEMLAEDGGPDDLVAAIEPLTGVATPFAPVAWASHTGMDAMFVPATAASPGLEMLAEDGGPTDLVAELDAAGVPHTGAATDPDGGTEPGPALPGSSYEFEIVGAPGEYFSLASMFVQSNDWFVGLRDIELYDADGNPISGDLTSELGIYDAGTEADQALGAGSDQAPRQAGPNTGGDDADTEVRSVELDLAGYLTVTIEPAG